MAGLDGNRGNLIKWLILGALGILMIVGQQLFKNILYGVVGIGLMLAAASGILGWWREKSKSPEALAGLLGNGILFLIGLWILLNPGPFDKIVNLLIGVVMIIIGIQWFLRAWRADRDILILVLSGITVFLGLFIAAKNAATTWLVVAEGISLIYTAVTGLITEKRLG